MSTERVIIGFLLTSIVAGIVGAIFMEIVMWLIGRARWAQGNMITAVGSLFTHTREHAHRVGVILHGVSAIGFAAVYTLAMMNLHLAFFPRAFFAGIGFGVLHGIIVALMLVWVVSERHPLEEFQEAGFAIGFTHLIGHVGYGAGVGLIIGLAANGGWIPAAH